jgi:peptidoglycan/LPS O-acetylase OafA/YrhL
VTGITAMAVLVLALGYPASAVGVPGQGRSNLDPPSLLAVALAVAQIGIFLIIRPRLMRPNRALTAVNRRSLPIYLTHQSVLVLVTSIAALTGTRPAALLTAPDGPVWAAQRLVWLPVFATLLAALVGLRRAHAH